MRDNKKPVRWSSVWAEISPHKQAVVALDRFLRSDLYSRMTG